jgi:hypothetical protein
MLSLWLAATVCLSGCDRDDSGHRKTPPPPPAGLRTVSGSTTEPRPGAAKPEAADHVQPGQQLPTSTEPSQSASRPTNLPPFLPLANAKVGEWGVYDALNSQQLRYEVLEVGLTRVKIRVTASLDGRQLGMPAIREEPRDDDPLAWEIPAGASRQTTPVTIRTAGREWNATLYEDRWIDEGINYIRRTWVSPDAPIFGMIRMEMTGNGQVEARMELRECNLTPAASRR